jgi:hypothetical protein
VHQCDYLLRKKIWVSVVDLAITRLMHGTLGPVTSVVHQNKRFCKVSLQFLAFRTRLSIAMVILF